MHTTDLTKRLNDFLDSYVGDANTCFREGNQDRLFRIDFQKIESLGCTVTKICTELSNPRQFTSDELVRLSEELAAKLTYLVEPIQVNEIDQEEKHVQLRSTPPRQIEKTRSYFELNLKNNGLHLCRYQKSPGGPREQVASVLTRDVLFRLVDDLADAI